MKIKSTCHAALDARNMDKFTASENILVQRKTLLNFIIMVMTYYVKSNDSKNNYISSNESNTCNTLGSVSYTHLMYHFLCEDL